MQSTRYRQFPNNCLMTWFHLLCLSDSILCQSRSSSSFFSVVVPYCCDPRDPLLGITGNSYNADNAM